MKTKTLSVRVEVSLVNDLELIESKTGVERASLIRALLVALSEFYRKNGFIQMPFAVVPKSAATKQ